MEPHVMMLIILLFQFIKISNVLHIHTGISYNSVTFFDGKDQR